MEVTFLWYNILIHTPITAINFIIILKEIMLEFLQVSERRDGHDSNVAIGLVDWYNMFSDIFYFLNPYNWLLFFIKEVQVEASFYS